MLLLSGKLLNLFPKNKFLTMVKHEAGHVMLWHTLTRLGFLTLPILAIAQEQTQLAEMPFPNLEGGLQELTDTAIPFLPCGIYLAFLIITLPWLSHQMEHEADIFACQRKNLRESEGDAECSAGLKFALLRLAALAPGNYERRSLFHPSLERRIVLIEKIERSPRKFDQFKRSFSRRRILVLICFSLTWIFMTLI
jgi:Zn-dependent protease with chaperone function